jgi:hypothetical protein
MGVVKLSTAGIRNYSKTSDFLSGNLPLSLGAFDLLETTTLTTSASSITFSGLSAYAADYKHLQIRMLARISVNTNFTSAYFQLNGDAASNYSTHELVGNAASVGSGGGANTSTPFVFRVAGTAADSGSFGAGIVDILDAFDTTKFTTLRGFSGGHFLSGANPAIVQLASANWRNTAALTSATLKSAVGDFVSYSRFSLYGVR